MSLLRFPCAAGAVSTASGAPCLAASRASATVHYLHPDYQSAKQASPPIADSPTRRGFIDVLAQAVGSATLLSGANQKVE